MSEMLDDLFTKNFLNLALSDALLPPQSQLKVPGPSRLNRSASFLAPPSPPDSLSLGLRNGGENASDEENGGSPWSSNIWSQLAPLAKHKQFPFRPDRSMSLTESSGGLLSSVRQRHNLDLFPNATAATTVAPPPGFQAPPPPSSPLPAQVPPLLSSNRYKTELCRGFQETGSCKYGNKCQFAHGEAELRGLYRHPKYKTEPCRTFYNFGYCPYGSRCHFIHEEKISDAAPPSKFQPNPNPRHQLRQSVSFAGFLGSSRSASPPSSFQSSSFSNVDPNLGFSRAPSVSPPPADLLSPVFGTTAASAAAAFQFGGGVHHHPTRSSAGDIHNIPVILEPKASRCVCGHGNNGNSNFNAIGSQDGGSAGGTGGGGNMLFPGGFGGARPAGLQRFSSEDSLEDSYSGGSSSAGSSGSESPTFDGSAGKRLTVFERLSLSD
ncbi:unnamed protein product [Ophioblennius macclurei]